MVLAGSTDLVTDSWDTTLASGAAVTAAELINGTVLAISRDGLALFRQRASLDDALGNGLIRAESFAEHFCLQGDFPLLKEHRAGYVGLADDRVLLIGLNDVRLFRNKDDALRNANECLRLSLQF